MDNINLIREKWDNIFFRSGIGIRVFNIIGSILVYISLNAVLPFWPEYISVEKSLLIVLALVTAIFFYLKPQGLTFFISIILFLCLCSSHPAAIICCLGLGWFVCGSATVNCVIAIMTPLLVAVLNNDADGFMPLNLSYFIFFIGIYFAHKTEAKTWKFIFPVYYALFSYALGTYGMWFGRETISLYTTAITSDTFAISFTQLITSELATVITMVFANIVLAFIFYKIMDIKTIKFLGLQLDVREGICFLVEMLIFIAYMCISTKKINMEMGIIVYQAIMAYIVTRFFASYKINRKISEKPYDSLDADGTKLISTFDVGRNTKEEILDVVSSYVDVKTFHYIIKLDKIPINGILLFGEDDLDKKYVIENIEKDINGEVVYLDAVKPNLNSNILSAIKNNSKFKIIFVNNFEKMFIKTKNEEKYENLFSCLDENIENEKVLFIFATNNISLLPNKCFDKKRISRIIHVDFDSSLSFDNTYVLLQVVGKGGNGVVYKAYHKRLKQEVVLKKILNPNNENLSNRNEVDLLNRIKHMYLPKVYDVFEKDHEFYTVMDYVPGETFDKKIKSGEKFSENQLLLWTHQLVEAVSYLHSLVPPIIHSDIKPGNIMLNENGNICLIDFNISAIFDNSNLKAIGTTPGYSPIEQYGGIENYQKILKRNGITVPVGGTSDKDMVPMKRDNITVLLDDNSIAEIDETEILQETEKSEETEVLQNTELLEKTDTLQETEILVNNELTEINSDYNVDYSGETAEKKTRRINLSYYAKLGITEKSDIYSIGATLYHIMTGEKPSIDFNNIRPIELYETGYSSEFLSIVKKCMKINPGERYRTVVEIKTDLNRIPME